jgi:hypothetical protein
LRLAVSGTILCITLDSDAELSRSRFAIIATLKQKMGRACNIAIQDAAN